MEYEDKLMYRLVKVAYGLALLLAIVISVAIGWESIPEQIVDYDKSYIDCDDGKRYTLENGDILLGYTDRTVLNPKEAKILCAYGYKNDYSSAYNALKVPTTQNYKIHIIEKTQGGWLQAIGWVVLGSLGSFIVLNLMRETLNYLFVGKPFDWVWLIGLLGLMIEIFSDNSKEEKG